MAASGSGFVVALLPMMLKRTVRFSSLLALLVAGCGDSGSSTTPSAPSTPSLDAGADPDTGEGTMDASEPATNCVANADEVSPRAAFCGDEFDWIHFVQAEIRSEQGPVAEAFPQMCVTTPDNYICVTPLPSCEDGTWFQAIPEGFRCVAKLVMTVGKSGDNPRFANTFCELDLESEGVLSLDEPLRLYEVAASENIPALGDPTMVRDIELGDGVTLPDFQPSAMASCFDDGIGCRSYEFMGTRRVESTEQMPCFIPADNPPEVLYATTLDEALGDLVGLDIAPRPQPIRLPNPESLAPGTTVDLYLVGGLDCVLADGTDVEEGEWAKFDEATVSADGQFLEGAEIPCLTWFGYNVE